MTCSLETGTWRLSGPIVIPAAPCHLNRATHGRFSGSAMFWSTELVVAGMAQWLAEIRGLIDWLRGEGVTVASKGLMAT